MSIRLYVGNLPKELDRQELATVFAEMGEGVSTKVITDRKTGKCRGFGFVTVRTDEEADQLIEKFNGTMFKELPLRIEKALPRTKGKNGEDGSAEGAEVEANSDGENNLPASSKSRRKREKASKSKRTANAPVVEADVQVDPRWASALEQLKQRFAEQQTLV